MSVRYVWRIFQIAISDWAALGESAEVSGYLCVPRIPVCSQPFPKRQRHPGRLGWAGLGLGQCLGITTSISTAIAFFIQTPPQQEPFACCFSVPSSGETWRLRKCPRRQALLLGDLPPLLAFWLNRQLSFCGLFFPSLLFSTFCKALCCLRCGSFTWG